MSIQAKVPSTTMYLIIGDASKTKPVIETGQLCDFNVSLREFTVQVSQNDYRNFKINDCDEIVFTTQEDAKAKIDKLPIVGQKVYYVRKKQKAVTEEVVSKYIDTDMYFQSEEKVDITSIEKRYSLTKRTI